MSIGRRVYLGILFAVLIAVLFEIVSDFTVTQIMAGERHRERERLEQMSEHFRARLWRYPQEREQLLHFFDPDGRESLAWVQGTPAVLAAADWIGTATVTSWAVGVYPLSDADAIEVWVARSPLERLLSHAPWLDLLDVPILLLGALLLARYAARSVRARLIRVSGDIAAASLGQVPQPVPLPADDAELASVVRAYNRMAKTAGRYLEREQTFTRYAAHELRTPLAAIKVQVERLKEGTADAAAVHAAMERNVVRMELVMNALLSLARGRNRTLAHEPLMEVVHDAIRVSAGEASRIGRIRVDLGSSDVLVCDPQLVRQALGNLLDNALSHTTGSVTLRAYVQGESLTLRVRDFGDGVPSADLNRLTEPFFRSDHSPPRGLGLGLALVDVVTRALDGELTLENSAEGFSATLRLPVVLEAQLTQPR